MNFDLVGHNFNFKLPDGEEYYKTCTGGFCSLTFFLILHTAALPQPNIVVFLTWPSTAKPYSSFCIKRTESIVQRAGDNLKTRLKSIKSNDARKAN